MKKIKLSAINKVSEIGSTERILSLTSDMKTLMAVNRNAITFINSLVTNDGFTGDNAHEIYEAGMSLRSAGDIPGFPTTAGILMSIQRLGRGNVNANQRVYQVLFSSSNTYWRRGLGDGVTVNYNAWKKFVVEDI